MFPDSELSPRTSESSATLVFGGNEEGGEAETDLYCMNEHQCQTGKIKPTEFLLMIPLGGDWVTTDWQGKIWGYCQQCAFFFENDYPHRTASYKAECEDRHYNRLCALQRRLNDAGREFQRFHIDYTVRIANTLAAGDPNGQSLNTMEAQMLTNIALRVSLCFVCRQPECHYFGLNSQWVKHVAKEWYKCPMCGARYQPFSTTNGQVENLAFVLQYTDPDSGLLMGIPTTWPPSDEMGWINKRIELGARQVKTRADVDAWHAKNPPDLRALIDAQKIPTNFTEFTPNPGLDGMFSPEWCWDKTRKFHGAFLPRYGGKEVEPFDDWPALITVISWTVAAQRIQVRTRQ